MSRSRSFPAPPNDARGFTYLGMLFAVALVGLSLAAAGELWSTSAKREKEAELLFVGKQFERALRSYHTSSPGARTFPRTLDELIADPRFPDRRRHLRRIYPDPMTGRAEWGLLMAGDRIIGVHSLSEEKPLRTFFSGAAGAGVAPTIRGPGEPRTYRDWAFMVAPESKTVKAEGTAAAAGPRGPPARK